MGSHAPRDPLIMMVTPACSRRARTFKGCSGQSPRKQRLVSTKLPKDCNAIFGTTVACSVKFPMHVLHGRLKFPMHVLHGRFSCGAQSVPPQLLYSDQAKGSAARR